MHMSSDFIKSDQLIKNLSFIALDKNKQIGSMPSILKT